MDTFSHPEDPVLTAQELAQYRTRLKGYLVREAQLTVQGNTRTNEEKRSYEITDILWLATYRLDAVKYMIGLKAASNAWFEHGYYLKRKKDLALKKFDTEAEQYWKEISFSLCQQVSTKLPQELRDTIYGYLIPPKTVPLIAYMPQRSDTLSQAAKACRFSAPCPSYSFDLEWKPDLPYLWQCNEVGHAALTDLVQNWYRVHTFLITDFSIISDFVTSDRWQLGLVPRQHVRHVRLSVTANDLAGEVNGVSPPSHVKRLRTNLEQLHHFSRRTKITIDIISDDYLFGDDSFLSPHRNPDYRWGSAIWERGAGKVLEFVKKLESSVFGVLRKLLEAGYTLKFIVDKQLAINPSKAEEIECDVWAAKILEFTEGVVTPG